MVVATGLLYPVVVVVSEQINFESSPKRVEIVFVVDSLMMTMT